MSLPVEQRPDPAEFLRQLSEAKRRAILRVYLGYAPGCGTTTAMLDEARRRAGRGTDVVVASYKVHDPASEALSSLEVVGGSRGLPSERPLNVEALLARNPDVACIDDLMGADENGRPRIDSVPRLLSAEITLLATLHVLSVSSAAAVAGLLGQPSAEPLLSDAAFDMIDEIEYVDITPDDLLRRIRERAILSPAQLAVAMQRELRPPVLNILRETALRMTAEHMDKQLSRYLPATLAPFEFRGRIVLCLPIRSGLEERIRRVAGYAASQGATLSVVVVRNRSLTDEERGWLGSYAALTHQQGGDFERLQGGNVAATLARYIRESQATEVVIGHRHRSRWRPWDTTSELIRRLAGVDVHILRATQPV